MTEQKAHELLHPDTTARAIAEVEYYAGFRGKEAAIEAINEACIVACKALEMQGALKACIEKLSDSRYECFVTDRNGVIELLKQFLVEGSAENDRE